MKMGNRQKGIIALIVMCVFSVGIIFGTDYITKWIDDLPVKDNQTELSGLKDGTYHAEKVSSFGGTGYVDMEIKNGKITSVVWDEIDADGNKKTVLAMEGKYVMTEDGANWAEQAKAMADYVIQNQSVSGLKLNEEGKTDQVATVSISVSDFVDMVQDCLNQANGGNASNNALKDGTYHAEKVSSFGGTGYVDMEIKNGKITSVVWDEIDADGNKKTVLAMEGKYVMTEDGANWAEQAKAMADYVIQNQSVSGLKLNEEGKTDQVATVSISVSDFVDMVQDCLNQANGGNASNNALKDGTYHAEKVSSFGGTGYVDMEIKNGKITSVIWDEIDADGNKKTVLAMEGKYVMTEDGANWAEQAKAMADYVIQNQSVSGLKLNEEGKTDQVATVSISVSDFVDMVQDCLNKAQI